MNKFLLSGYCLLAKLLPRILFKYNQNVDDMLKKVEGLKPIADELGEPLSQLAIVWCAANPVVSSVITGATKESQVSSKNIISS